jgi:hypothetical protein
MKSIIRRRNKTTHKKRAIKRTNKYRRMRSRRMRSRRMRSRKNRRIRKKKYKGGNNDVCCICDKETDSILTPISCERRPTGVKTHIICGDCWWPFARENTDHACPGCKKGIPLTNRKNSNKKETGPPEVIDLSK